MAVCAAGRSGVGPGVKRRFLSNMSSPFEMNSVDRGVPISLSRNVAFRMHRCIRIYNGQHREKRCGRRSVSVDGFLLGRSFWIRKVGADGNYRRTSLESPATQDRQPTTAYNSPMSLVDQIQKDITVAMKS